MDAVSRLGRLLWIVAAISAVLVSAQDPALSDLKLSFFGQFGGVGHAAMDGGNLMFVSKSTGKMRRLTYDNEIIRAIAPTDHGIYVGGSFLTIGGVACSNIALFDGVQFVPLGKGLNGPVNTLHYADDQLYVGGEFTGLGDTGRLAMTVYSHFAIFRNGSWVPAPYNGVDKDVNVIVPDGRGNLILGGSFSASSDDQRSTIGTQLISADSIFRALTEDESHHITLGNVSAGMYYAMKSRTEPIILADGQRGAIDLRLQGTSMLNRIRLANPGGNVTRGIKRFMYAFIRRDCSRTCNLTILLGQRWMERPI